MSIKQRARALMLRYQQTMQHRQQCAMTRAAAEIGLSNEAVEQWMHSQGKARPTVGIHCRDRVAMS